jgi:hypothetical protein
VVSPGLAMSTQPGTGTLHDRSIRRLTIGFCLVALVLGAFEAWTSRFEMNPDGIQYLDNAAAYRQGDFTRALNTQWSPLHPWLIAAATAAVRSSREQNFPLAHAVNFCAYALSLAAFLFFLRPLRRIPALLPLAYAAFLYCSLDLTNLRFVTPDVLVSGFAFISAGLLLRMANGRGSLRFQIALGAALGLGYLAKAPFLPLAVCALAAAFFFGRTRALTALLVFCGIAGPYVAALSRSNGRFTVGDSAKLNLAWHVNGVPNTNWQGGPAENGQPVHPTRQLSSHPAIYEFAGPVTGTYPPWYDPSYWNAGLRVAYHPRQIARAIFEQIRLYAYLLHHRQLPLLFALVALFLLGRDKRGMLARATSVWPVLILGAVPFAMYAPVHAEGRYLAPFFVLLWTALFTCVLEDRRVSNVISATAVMLMCIETAVSIPAPAQFPSQEQFEIARDLTRLGLKPGDSVAIISGNLAYNWAYLAGARITYQISFSDREPARAGEWQLAREILSGRQRPALAALAVAPPTEGVTDQPGWIPLATPDARTTPAFAYPIRSSGAY